MPVYDKINNSDLTELEKFRKKILKEIEHNEALLQQNSLLKIELSKANEDQAKELNRLKLENESLAKLKLQTEETLKKYKSRLPSIVFLIVGFVSCGLIIGSLLFLNSNRFL